MFFTREYFIDLIDSIISLDSTCVTEDLRPLRLRISDAGIERKCTENPLQAAVKLGDLHTVREILGEKHRFALDLNQDGYTALHLACWLGHEEIVRELIASNSELCLVKDKFGRTALHTAALKGRLETMKDLLAACPEAVMAQSATSETPLHIAITHDQDEAVQFLLVWLEENTDYCHVVNSKNCSGNTALHLAISRKKLQILNILLADSPTNNNAVDVNAMNDGGFTALDIFNVLPQSGEMDMEIEKILRRAGALRGRDVFKETSHSSNNEVLINLGRNWSQPCHLQSCRSMQSEIDVKSEVRGAVLVTATLLATITFHAALSPPGGALDSYTHNSNVNGNIPENSDLNGPFVMFNSMAFFTSVAMIMIMVHELPLKPWLLISLFSLLGAYMCSILAISRREALMVLFLGSPFILLAAASKCLALHRMWFNYLPWKSIRNYEILNHRSRASQAFNHV